MTTNKTRTELSCLTERADAKQLSLVLGIVRSIVGKVAQV